MSLSHLFVILIYAAVLYMCDSLYTIILNKSKNATLQYSIFCEKVLDEKYLLKLNNVFQISSKRFVETPPICLLMSELFSLLCIKLYSLNYASVHVQKRLLRLSEFVILVLQ